MITGRVTSDGSEALVSLVVRSSISSREQEIEAVTDTGFDSFLTLPSRTIRGLDLPQRGSARAIMADGSVRDVDIFAAEVMWDGRLRSIEVEEAETTPLVGMGLLSGYELRIECRGGGSIEIEELPGW